MSPQANNQPKVWKIILLVTFVAVILANYLPFIFSQGQDRFDDDPDTLVDAAGYAFSILGIIFLWMLGFCLYKFRETSPTPALRQAYVFLFVAGLASIAFVPISFTDVQLLGTFNLWWHLVALIAANRALRAHRAQGAVGTGWIYFAPSVYLGWISAATVIATALGLQEVGVTFSASTGPVIAAGLLLVLTGVGSWLTLHRDGFYGFTVTWALIAVGVEQADQPLIQYTAWAGAVLIALMGISRLFNRDKDFFYATAR
jgi:hypothetical protein